MAADPPVMLMDEPFGAIDPITRHRLQDEFLRLQEDINKTIIFVTHDIDEAIKMGDRIAILEEQSHIAQFAPPEEILTSPANDFVRDFVGSGASLKRLNLSRVRDLDQLTDVPVGTREDGAETLRRRLLDSHWTGLLLLDDAGRPDRWLLPDDLRDADHIGNGLPAEAVVEPQATLHDALDEMLVGNVGCAIVVDGEGRHQGVLDMDTVITAIRSMRDATSDYHRLAKFRDEATL